jgi:hypothetical protein
MKMNNPALKLTDVQQIARALQAVDACGQATSGQCTVSAMKAKHKALGVKGMSVLLTTLPYLSFNNMWLVPVAHAFYYGVVKGFVAFLLRPMSEVHDGDENVIGQADRSTISGRARHVLLTSEFGRKYKDVVKYHKSYRMEDWQHFVETYSLYVFMDVLPDHCKKIWEHLRHISLHYCRRSPDPVTAAQRHEAAGRLFKVGEMLEEHGFPPKLLTSNLHLLVCRLPAQERVRGVVCTDLEYWVERVIRKMKDVIQGRVSADPEKTFANVSLLQQTLAAALRQNPELSRMERWLTSTVVDKGMDGPEYDAGDMETRSQLLGRGVGVARQWKGQWMEAVVVHVRGMDTAEGWCEEDVRGAFRTRQLVHAYKRGSIRDEEIVGTHSCHRGRYRQNCWLMVEWQVLAGTGRNRRVEIQKCVCLVLGYVRVQHPTSHQQLQDLPDRQSRLKADHDRQVLAHHLAHRQKMIRAGGDSDARRQLEAEYAVESRSMHERHVAELASLEKEVVQTAPLRLAMVRVYAPCPQVDGMYVAEAGRVMEDCYAVDLLTVTCKLVAFMPDGLCQGTMYFAPFYNVSKAF